MGCQRDERRLPTLDGQAVRMKIILVGKNGQLGHELQRSLAPLGQLMAWGRETADLSKPETLLDLVIAAKPDVIVNAAAYTAVDKAESESELAHTVNAESPAVLAKAARMLNCRLIHYSTDYVFDGLGSTPWTEDAATQPQNVYGASKLAGEQAITASGCDHLIFRTSWVYSHKGDNFAKTMLRLAQERDALSVIDDQIGAPTDARWLADMTARVMDLVCLCAVEETPINGIYHAASAGEVSWHGYASYLIARARNMGFPVRVAPDAIQAVPSSAFLASARRPHNSRLNCTKLIRTFGMTPPTWQTGVDQLLQHLQS